MIWFETIFYQPVLNVLVASYALLERADPAMADMGIAVVILTILLRILMLPLSFAGRRSRTERYDISKKIIEIQESSHLPADQVKKKVRKIFRANRRVVVSEGVNFVIQAIIFFVLYRIFSKGLTGVDWHLLYDFTPRPLGEINLMFLGRFDMSHPSLVLNLVQSLAILLVEIVSILDSPFPVTRREFVRYVITLPVVSFVLFMFLPSGKKVFVITTLLFSAGFVSISILARLLSRLGTSIDEIQAREFEKQHSH